MPTPDGDARSQAVAAIRSARTITAVCHENPDADTVAGALAIAHIGTLLGKETEVVSADGIPPNLRFLPGADAVLHEPGLAPDLVVVCDAATLERIGPLMDHRDDIWSGARVLNIDHHVTNTAFADINLVIPTAAATCEVIVDLVPPLALELDEDLATLLLTGIVRDTQGFTDPATSPFTLRLASTLVEAGASLPEIHYRVISQLPHGTLTLWGRVLSGVREYPGGRITGAFVEPEMLEATKTSQHDADGVAEFIARSSDTEIVFLLRPIDEQSCRLSLRTKGDVDAARIARAFGGGGHHGRAGCTVHLPRHEAEDAVVKECMAALDAR